MQYVDLRSVLSNRITGLGERLCTHIHGGRQGLVTRFGNCLLFDRNTKNSIAIICKHTGCTSNTVD